MSDSLMKKVLLIDDDEMSHMLVAASMKDICLESVLSGEQGVMKAEEELYDLILIDYIMPGMDGFETFEQLGYGINAETPCILMSANEGEEFEYEVHQAGFYDYIKKPVVRTQLMELCDKLIAGEIGAEGKSDVADVKNAEGPAMTGMHEFEPEPDCGGVESIRLVDRKTYIDRDFGLSFCEDEEIYRAYCSSFLKEWSVKMGELSSYYEERNLPLYRSHVHGLKNNAMYVGCKELSEISRTLEIAARSGDLKTIETHHTQCVNILKDVLAEISEM